ncbi:MAG: serine/threonine protein phosphatase [Syntrophales bacterium]|jgi:serine/threonine protein phosphatase 1|nr:serine/threonine protein phosphatase [Syntrophales bacterium]MDY0045489.1 metallophosphoesterase family protein [Syntrophales bacterium]
MERIFAIGDIHGCLAKLEKMIRMIPFDHENDRLVFIGDYIDRGPDSKGVVDYVITLRHYYEKVICLMGNHEQMLLDFVLHGIGREIYFLNGGDATADSYGYIHEPAGIKIKIPPDHINFFTTLLPFYETDEYIFVHAGLRPGIPLSRQDFDDTIWIRNEFIQSNWDFGKIIIFGHTPARSPLLEFNKIGIDTGAVYGGKLTCIELPSRKIYQV